ncbi:PREDICTED: outer envelope pore protein 37, chloroplastic-like [Tarenaya hassleriana]|uniref:outer envelope pore protein 37, chloroplastic-like n=1 Tax=Tarenaya hassleriana TaxID=28532 RepID=UPI00053C6336|nr:PREDICTED: outer envelope pore protein 37, chloroplastic-like [Tarenaya hassleriana]
MADPSPQAETSESPSSSAFSGLRRPKLRVTSEFDSDSLVFFNKLSCKLFDNLGKVKLSFQNNAQRQVSQPQLSFTSKYLSILYDLEEHNAFLKSTVAISPRLQLRALHNVKAQEGEVAMEANLGEPGYSLELSSPVPVTGYPRATLKFPLGEVSLQEKQEEEEEKNRILSVDGILKHKVLNGVCTAQYSDEELRMRYAYKDDALTFSPTISLPSNALSFDFKRRFSPLDKLSYSYKFDSNVWSAVYKRKYGNDYKLKAGYDSEIRIGWASLWVGDEAGKVKTTPLKMKVQLMLQVPQDNLKSSALMFRVKKRWDL